MRDKTFKTAGNPRYKGYESELFLMVCRFFEKKSAGSGAKSIPDQQLKIKFKRCKKYFSFKNSISSADLANIQLMSNHNKSFRFLLCVMDVLANKLGYPFERQKRRY